ncbi:hypothetical protein F5876DRAFT_81909 [Lentinula aff. lateritia]|uniref:Uncharacterized protein n=1 Tax=Lentinula aff. lateritia TaxID=2804960 RepID=A0ACC1TLR5_9AGAR|nr:hypothetical protein F5876DRAFT_81909 [Lentinula aff. lateritia]
MEKDVDDGTIGSVVAVDAGSSSIGNAELTFVKVGSAPDPSRITSSSDLTTLPMLPTSSVGTGTNTLSATSTMIPSSSPSATLSSNNSIRGLSREAGAITLAVIGTIFVLGTLLVMYIRKRRFIKQRRQIAAFRERLAQISGLSALGARSTWSSQSGSMEVTSHRSSHMDYDGLGLNHSDRNPMSERERGSGRSYQFTSGSSSQIIF